MTMSRKRQPRSLRARVVTAVLLCWILPVLGVMALAGYLLGSSYERAARQELQTRMQNAMEQLEMRMDAVFEASKTVSYDGVVRNAYRLYQREGDSAALYTAVTEYLTQNFTRDERIDAIFLSFWDEIDVHPYAAGRGDFGFRSQKEYRENIEADVLEKMSGIDTDILLLEYGGELYVARNLLDSHFDAYATVVLLCSRGSLFQSLDQLETFGGTSLLIDDAILLDQDGILRSAATPKTATTLKSTTAKESASTMEMKSEAAGDLGAEGEGEQRKQAEQGEAGEQDQQGKQGRQEKPGKQGKQLELTGEASGHRFLLTAELTPYNVWRNVPQIRTATLIVVLLVVPMLLAILFLFRFYVTRPVDILVDADNRLENGERGYHIDKKANSREFARLYGHFNEMSAELKNQFERSYREQQALQQAQIKALQSQINPHFLNNTLEIINWEARMAGCEDVSAMIEALSTMMDGALGRDGRSQVPLRVELGYVDAYLYIIRQRLGERLEIEKEIDESLLDTPVPRLVLQPLAENAVEHDLTPRRGGNLCLRVYRGGARIVLEVEHDGVMSEEDLVAVRVLSASGTPAADSAEMTGKVGLRNVCQRLKLLYGDEGELSISQMDGERILTRVRFPADEPKKN